MKHFKKLLVVTFSLIFSFCLYACSCAVNENDNRNHTVTFEQTGVQDIVKTVKNGETLTDIPTPQTKTGYTVVWDMTDFTSITESRIVKAIETPNEYTVILDENGGEELVDDTVTVEYDAVYSLPRPTHMADLIFKGWYSGNTNVNTSGIWRMDKSVALTAVWQCQITFRQEGVADKTFLVDYGKTFTDIPEIENVPLGVESHWSISDFSSVTENTIVTAIYGAKEFSICLDWNDGTGKTETVIVTYGENYSLDIPSRLGYTFECWTYNGEEIPHSGIWTIGGENIKLKARWKNNADMGDWTPAH